MGRPIYPYELADPDFSWLITHFQENHPGYKVVENTCLPVVFIEHSAEVEADGVPLPVLPAEELGTEGEEQDVT